MMGGSAGTMAMGGSMMALSLLWMLLVAVALVALMVLLVRGVNSLLTSALRCPA
jgi:hypothetical protein